MQRGGNKIQRTNPFPYRQNTLDNKGIYTYKNNKGISNENKLVSKSPSYVRVKESNELEKLKLDNKRLTELCSAKDKEINSLKEKLSFYEKQMLKMENELRQYKEHSGNHYRREHLPKTQVDRDHEFAKRLQREMLRHPERFDNEWPNYVDPVQEVENAIINEICPNPDQMSYEQLLSLENQIGKVNTGLTKQELKLIPVKAYTSTRFDDQKQCIICQDDFELGDKVKELSCSHIYHRNCIDEWLVKEKKCPCCNKEITLNK